MAQTAFLINRPNPSPEVIVPLLEDGNRNFSAQINSQLVAQGDEREKVLKIVCADDNFYNLETLRCVFSSLKMLDSCSFVNDGRQAVDTVIQNMKDSDFGRKYELA